MTICEGGGDGTYGPNMTFSGLMVFDASVAAGFAEHGRVAALRRAERHVRQLVDGRDLGGEALAVPRPVRLLDLGRRAEGPRRRRALDRARDRPARELSDYGKTGASRVELAAIGPLEVELDVAREVVVVAELDAVVTGYDGDAAAEHGDRADEPAVDEQVRVADVGLHVEDASSAVTVGARAAGERRRPRARPRPRTMRFTSPPSP